jgi:hypothetical protein
VANPASLSVAPGMARSVRRELILLGVGLILGLLLVPILIDLLGPRALGPYAGGGLGAFLGHFYRGLGSGGLGFWMVALGPYVMILLVRGLGFLVRA